MSPSRGCSHPRKSCASCACARRSSCAACATSRAQNARIAAVALLKGAGAVDVDDENAPGAGDAAARLRVIEWRSSAGASVESDAVSGGSTAQNLPPSSRPRKSRRRDDKKRAPTNAAEVAISLCPYPKREEVEAGRRESGGAGVAHDPPSRSRHLSNGGNHQPMPHMRGGGGGGDAKYSSGWEGQQRKERRERRERRERLVGSETAWGVGSERTWNSVLGPSRETRTDGAWTYGAYPNPSTNGSNGSYTDSYSRQAPQKWSPQVPVEFLGEGGGAMAPYTSPPGQQQQQQQQLPYAAPQAIQQPYPQQYPQQFSQQQQFQQQPQYSQQPPAPSLYTQPPQQQDMYQPQPQPQQRAHAVYPSQQQYPRQDGGQTQAPPPPPSEPLQPPPGYPQQKVVPQLQNLQQQSLFYAPVTGNPQQQRFSKQNDEQNTAKQPDFSGMGFTAHDAAYHVRAANLGVAVSPIDSDVEGGGRDGEATTSRSVRRSPNLFSALRSMCMRAEGDEFRDSTPQRPRRKLFRSQVKSSRGAAAVAEISDDGVDVANRRGRGLTVGGSVACLGPY